MPIRRKHAGWKLKTLVAILAVLTVGIVYEQVGEYLDGREYQPAGQVVEVNGHNMHVFAEGKGSATVVFASGWEVPCPYVDFYPLHSVISKHARIAVYDRPGYGWSEAADTPRNIDTMAGEVHQLLEKSGQKPPYVLVGHSIGSLEVLRFAQLYRDEVKGMVLIDGSNPEMYAHMAKPSALAYFRAGISHDLIYLINKAGISRLLCAIMPNFYSSTVLSTARNSFSLAPRSLIGLDQAMFLKNFNNRNQLAEGRNKRNNASEVAAHGHLKNVPLVIITSEQTNSYREARMNQSNLFKWSTDSKQIIVKDSGHAVHWYHPEVINREILAILNE